MRWRCTVKSVFRKSRPTVRIRSPEPCIWNWSCNPAHRCNGCMEAHRRLFGADAVRNSASSKRPAGHRFSPGSLSIRCITNASCAPELCVDPIRFSYGTIVRFMARISHLPEGADLVTMAHPAMLPTMNIGETIRNYRLQKGMSQGDIEKRTGLLRCYLSRVENGHTIPSLDTLSKIAGAMELPLSQFFAEPGHSNGSKGLPQLSDDEVRFLSQIRRYSTSLNDSDRKLVLAMVKKMASNSGK